MSQAGPREAANLSKAWPFEEARKIVQRVERAGRTSVLFETGYGPSGLPHIGTFGEVARTTMVRHAFRVLTDDKIKTRLLAFSDDMDGLRKVPDNIPNKEMCRRPSRQAADAGARPVRHASSFGAHNNARLRALPRSLRLRLRIRLLDRLLHVGPLRCGAAAHAGALRAVHGDHAAELARRSAPRPIRRFCRSIRRPASSCRCRSTAIDAAAGTIAWRDPDTGEAFETPVTGGHCKLQWKPDWAMRWYALGVDYEMAGKDLIDSVKLSGADRPRARRRRRRRASTTSCSSTRRGRRSRSRRATA